MIRAGARGYVTKNISGEELADAVRRVARWRRRLLSPPRRLRARRLRRPAPQPQSELDALTAREREVLQHIARGYMYKEIALRLDISPKTVEAHVSSVLRKLQLSSRHELTRWAADAAWTSERLNIRPLCWTRPGRPTVRARRQSEDRYARTAGVHPRGATRRCAFAAAPAAAQPPPRATSSSCATPCRTPRPRRPAWSGRTGSASGTSTGTRSRVRRPPRQAAARAREGRPGRGVRQPRPRGADRRSGAAAAGETAPTGVLRIGAASATQAHQASTAAVAVIDTGIDLAHPDLNAVSGKNCTTSPQKTALARDDNGHGTHVAGTIGAENDGGGVVGVAPGTRIYAVKVLNASGQGTWSQVVCGIDWVTQKARTLNIKVANMSLAGFGLRRRPVRQPDRRRPQPGDLQVDGRRSHLRGRRRKQRPGLLLLGAGRLSGRAHGDRDVGQRRRGRGPRRRPHLPHGRERRPLRGFSNFADPTDTEGRRTWWPPRASASTPPGSVAATGPCRGRAWPRPTPPGQWRSASEAAASSGPCAGLAPADVIRRIRADAAASVASIGGFEGDPFTPVAGRYFGPWSASRGARSGPANDSTEGAPPSLSRIAVK